MYHKNHVPFNEQFAFAEFGQIRTNNFFDYSLACPRPNSVHCQGDKLRTLT